MLLSSMYSVLYVLYFFLIVYIYASCVYSPCQGEDFYAPQIVINITQFEQIR